MATSELERLKELLDEKDRLLNEKDSEIVSLNDQIESEQRWRESYWTRHQKRTDDGGLPVPRLEIRWEPADEARDGYNWVANYCLIYRHFLGDIIAVPLGQTKVTSQMSLVQEGKVGTPFRDGAHIRNDAQHLGLPAFAVCGEVKTLLDK